MSKRLQKHAKTLEYLSTCDKNLGNSIIKSAKPDLICCISEICHNLLQGNVDLSQRQVSKLAKYKNQIRSIAGKKATIKSKKRLIQKGGFLSALLGTLASTLLGPLVKGIFGGGNNDRR